MLAFPESAETFLPVNPFDEVDETMIVPVVVLRILLVDFLFQLEPNRNDVERARHEPRDDASNKPNG